MMLINFILAATILLPQTVEIADSSKEREWGLMGRRTIGVDEGMLFVYPEAQFISLWMFNVFIDLSVAFIDEEGVILEIQPLKAFPSAMDPSRTVKTLKDLKKYPPTDPTVLFFRNYVVRSTKEAKYALEMPAGWFKKNNIKPGDRLEVKRLLTLKEI